MATETVESARIVKLKSRREVAERTIEFEVEKPSGFEFKAGQYAEIALLDPAETDAEGNARVFSIITAPDEGSEVRHSPPRVRVQGCCTRWQQREAGWSLGDYASQQPETRHSARRRHRYHAVP